MPIKEITLYSTAGNSDKIYILTIEKLDGGFIVNYTHGRREVGPFQSGCKTVQPHDKRKPRPVSLEEAEDIFDEVVKDKKTGKSHYFEKEGESAKPQTPANLNGARQDIVPMELTAILDAQVAVRILRDPNFATQEKHDGIRLQLHATPEKVTAYNRSGGARAFSADVEAEAKQLAKAGAFLLDGELVGNLFHVFDILEWKGADHRNTTFKNRMMLLDMFFAQTRGSLKAIRLVPTAFAEPSKIAMLQNLHEAQREGLVIKKLDSRYEAGRSKEWFKFKFVATASVLVTKINEKRSVTMSLLHAGELREVGHLPIPTNKEIPAVGSIVEVRYRKADPTSLNLIETVFLTVREDVSREDCTTQQLKFTTKAA